MFLTDKIHIKMSIIYINLNYHEQANLMAKIVEASP